MKLNKLEDFQTSYKKTVSLSISIGLIMGIAFVISIIFLSYKLSETSKNVLVIDKSGTIYTTKAGKVDETRVYEYENHVRMFYTYWYGFDENNYNDHIEKGLNLIGEAGKELYNEYNDLQVKTNLAQKNLRYEVEIKKIVVDMQSNPVSGYIEGIQTCIRAKGRKSRYVCAKFTLYDVARSETNVHGCKIDKWSVYDTREILSEQDSISSTTPIQ
jgi:hypothetical protein